MTVNNFFAYWFKEIDIRRYGDNICILPTNTTVNIYRYLNSLSKHMRKKALKTPCESTLLYSKRPVTLTGY